MWQQRSFEHLASDSRQVVLCLKRKNNSVNMSTAKNSTIETWATAQTPHQHKQAVTKHSSSWSYINRLYCNIIWAGFFVYFCICLFIQNSQNQGYFENHRRVLLKDKRLNTNRKGKNSEKCTFQNSPSNESMYMYLLVIIVVVHVK